MRNPINLIIPFIILWTSCQQSSPSTTDSKAICKIDSAAILPLVHYIYDNQLIVVARTEIIHIGYLHLNRRRHCSVGRINGKVVSKGADTIGFGPVQFYNQFSDRIFRDYIIYAKSTDTSVSIDVCNERLVFKFKKE